MEQNISRVLIVSRSRGYIVPVDEGFPRRAEQLEENSCRRGRHTPF